MFECLVYFNNLWHKFELIDTDGDRRLTAKEFTSGCRIVGVKLGKVDALAVFESMAEAGGHILFADFCSYCATAHLGEGHSEEEKKMSPEEFEALRKAQEEVSRPS